VDGAFSSVRVWSDNPPVGRAVSRRADRYTPSNEHRRQRLPFRAVCIDAVCRDCARFFSVAERSTTRRLAACAFTHAAERVLHGERRTLHRRFDPPRHPPRRGRLAGRRLLAVSIIDACTADRLGRTDGRVAAGQFTAHARSDGN